MRVAAQSAIKRSHNIWFAGQSNCAGFNTPTPDPATYPPLKGQYIFNPQSQTWEKLQQNFNNSGCPFGFTGFFGAELAIMQGLYDYYGADQFMMKYAQGGTSLAEDTADQYNWSPDSPNDFMYKGLRDSYFAAKNSFPAIWMPPKIFIWWQGEDDCTLGDSVAYGANFRNFFERLKNECNLPDLLVMFIGLADTQTAYDTTSKTNINTFKINYSINGNKFISTDSASVQSGGVHFDSAGQIDIGTNRILPVLISMLDFLSL